MWRRRAASSGIDSDPVSVLLQHGNLRSAAHGPNGLFGYLYPPGIESPTTGTRQPVAFKRHRSGPTASVVVLRRSVKQVCHRAIEPLSAIAKSGQSCHASKS